MCKSCKMAKHFWIKNPEIKNNSYYCVNSNGILVRLGNRYEFVTLSYDELLRIITEKTRQELYSRCKELFDKKFPQAEEEKKELSIEEQSKLEDIFSNP